VVLISFLKCVSWLVQGVQNAFFAMKKKETECIAVFTVVQPIDKFLALPLRRCYN